MASHVPEVSGVVRKAGRCGPAVRPPTTPAGVLLMTGCMLQQTTADGAHVHPGSRKSPLAKDAKMLHLELQLPYIAEIDIVKLSRIQVCI